jgi:protease-4
MSSLAASGGYYIAMDCDRIVASPMTLTGSIGIFAMFPTVDRALARLGVHSDGVGTTALSDAFRPDRPVSEATRQILQQNIEYEYQQFIGHVARARKQDVAAIDKIAQGRVWSGADAKRLGLVDQLGGYRDAIKLAAELAGLGKDYDVVYDEIQPGFGDALGLRLRGALTRALVPLLPKDALPALPQALAPLVRELRSIERLSDPRGIYSYCLACRLD